MTLELSLVECSLLFVTTAGLDLLVLWIGIRGPTTIAPWLSSMQRYVSP